jgi:hypothetical protein
MSNKFEAYKRATVDVVQQGFKVEFANGMVASVAFGSFNYCDGGKNTAEVLAWKASNFVSVSVPGFSEGNVVGHLSPEDVVKYLAAVAAL